MNKAIIKYKYTNSLILDYIQVFKLLSFSPHYQIHLEMSISILSRVSYLGTVCVVGFSINAALGAMKSSGTHHSSLHKVCTLVTNFASCLQVSWRGEVDQERV